MASDPQRKQGHAAPPGARPYALRPLLHDVPLSADGNDEDVKINCVDYYGMRGLVVVENSWEAC
jgi:hypothetical protein